MDGWVGKAKVYAYIWGRERDQARVVVKSTGTGLNGVPCCVVRPRVPSPYGGRRLRPLPKMYWKYVQYVRSQHRESIDKQQYHRKAV